MFAAGIAYVLFCVFIAGWNLLRFTGGVGDCCLFC